MVVSRFTVDGIGDPNINRDVTQPSTAEHQATIVSVVVTSLEEMRPVAIRAIHMQISGRGSLQVI